MEVTAGPAESNGSLLPGLWRDSLHVTCGLTACTPGSAQGPTLGNEYGKTLPFTFNVRQLGYVTMMPLVKSFILKWQPNILSAYGNESNASSVTGGVKQIVTG